MNAYTDGEPVGRTKSLRRIDIQVMRGIAVLAVLLFHTRESWFTAGYLGVDVFFVVSGFVVTPLIIRIFLDQNGSRTINVITGLRDFYIRRLYRLAPALGVSLIFSLVIILIMGPVSDHVRFASQGLAALFLIGNLGAYHYSGGNYFAPNPNPLIHLWSLSAEEQIYFVLPIVVFIFLLIASKKGRLHIQFPLVILGALAFLADSVLRIFPQFLQNHGVTDVPGLMFYSPISRLWEFCIGSSAYFLAMHTERPLNKAIRYVNWILVFALSFSLFMPIHGYRVQSLVISLLAAGAMYFRVFEELPNVLYRLNNWLGDRSYSIYLVHMPLLYVAIYSPLFNHKRIPATIVAFALSIALGSLIYQQIEERFRLKTFTRDFRLLNFRNLVILFVATPILLFAGMRFGAEKHYWGIDPNPTPPAYARTIDYACYTSLSPCYYPASNPKGEALLIGDSHAASLFQAFAESTALENVSSYVWQKNSCQFISRETISSNIANLIGYGRPEDKNSCFGHNAAIVTWLRLHPNAFVFISQRSSRIRPSGIDEAEYRNIIVNNLVYLHSLSARLTVIGPNPEFPDETQFFQGGLLIWQKQYNPPKRFSTSSMYSEPEQDNSLYLTHLPSNGIGYIDTVSQFCNHAECTRWERPNWLYQDYQHLSVFGAERLKPLIREQIRQDLK